jgi:hypothetical protein
MFYLTLENRLFWRCPFCVPEDLFVAIKRSTLCGSTGDHSGSEFSCVDSGSQTEKIIKYSVNFS